MDSAAFNLPSEATAVLRETASYRAQRCQAELRMVEPPTEEELKMLEDDDFHLGNYIRTLQDMDIGLFSTLYALGFMDGYLHALRTLKFHSMVGDYLESDNTGDMTPPTPPSSSPDSSKDVLGDFLRSMGVDPDNGDTGKVDEK